MQDLSLTPLSEWGFFVVPPHPCVIAGPCSAETEAQVMDTAAGLKTVGINVFRAGIWKPRSHPGSFEGIGEEGLGWLQKVKSAYGMKVCTEVASAKHVSDCLVHGVDMVWIGARTTANPFLVQEIAEALRGTDIPVLVKNPVNPDLELWIGALERLNRVGITKLGAIHRGVSSSEKLKYRNDPLWSMAVELRARFPHLPIFADPSHMGGSREYLRELSQRALDLGFEGLMIESHCNPQCALSDAGQQIEPAALRTLLESLSARSASSPDEEFLAKLDRLRERIDVIDENLIRELSERMKISAEIGELKRGHGVAIVQPGRWEKVLEKVRELASQYGLDEEFVLGVFEAIHAASVKEQEL